MMGNLAENLVCIGFGIVSKKFSCMERKCGKANIIFTDTPSFFGFMTVFFKDLPDTSLIIYFNYDFVRICFRQIL